jgi:hypothetical protein
VNAAETQLAALLDRALVWVGRPNQRNGPGGGSGVWIGPDAVLTCAHVVPDEPASPILIGWNGSHYTGVVAERQPPAGRGRLWPFPDLAIVRVAVGPMLTHACAWLDEEPEVVGTRVMAFGHSAVLSDALAPDRVAGHIMGFPSFDTGRLWRFSDNEVAPGMSGGPVLNLDTGAVCGIVSTARQPNTDRGGFLVPVQGLRRLATRREIIRAHDAFHAVDRTWSTLRERWQPSALGGIAACPISARQQTDLFGLLAMWPDWPDLEDLYAASSSQQVPVMLSELRDVASVLMEESPAPGTLHPLLRFTNHLAEQTPDAGPRLQLREWTARVAGRLGADEALDQWRRQQQERIRADASGPTPGRAVVVAIEPSGLGGGRYHLAVWVRRSATDIVCRYRAIQEFGTLQEAIARGDCRSGRATADRSARASWRRARRVCCASRTVQ